MKIKDKHIKILKNFLIYNENFNYNGSKVLRTNNVGVYIEADIPNFLDIPIYTKDLGDILKFIDEDTDITFTYEGNIDYLLLQKGNSQIKYRLSKNNIIESQMKSFNMNNYNITTQWFSFNLDNVNYNKLMKNAKLLNCNLFDIYSIDDHKIGIKAYNINDKNNKQYSLVIEKEHNHHDNVSTIMLETFELVAASDYNIETGTITGKSGTERKVTKVKAFCEDIEVKYLIINK